MKLCAEKINISSCVAYMYVSVASIYILFRNKTKKLINKLMIYRGMPYTPLMLSLVRKQNALNAINLDTKMTSLPHALPFGNGK